MKMKLIMIKETKNFLFFWFNTDEDWKMKKQMMIKMKNQPNREPR